MPVGFPVKDNYVTGDVLTAANMNDFAGTLNTVPSTIAASAAGKNKILNSNFSVWQRGTSFTAGTVALYTADRWQSYRAVLGSTITRQATNDTTNLPNIQYCARIARDSGNTSTSQIFYSQSLETVNSIPLAGQTVTATFYARAGANYSMASSALGFQLSSGTGTDQNIVSGFTGGSNIINTAFTLTTTWQRFTRTVTVPTNSTQLAFNYYFTPVGTAGANDYFEVTGVQLEASNTASPYAPNGATYQAELAACQRYYFRTTANGAGFYMFGTGYSRATTEAVATINFPVPMRTSPTALEQSGTAGDYAILYDNTSVVCTSVPTYIVSNTFIARTVFTAGAVMTLGRGAFGSSATGNTTAYLGWSAEL
jgi:hypothetical protein